jgi:large subunit ribosomal protein L25
MQSIKLAAEARKETGKGEVRRLRAGGRIPAVAYGPNLKSTSLAVSPKDILGVLGTEYGRNAVIELDIKGEKKVTVLLTDFQYHPVTRSILHADFLEIREDQPVDFDVPFEALGKAKGVVAGGVLRQVFRKLPVRCLPANLPVKLSHDVTELELDHSVAAKDVKVPEGVQIRLPAEQTVLAVVTEKKKYEEEEAAAAAAGAPGAAPGAPGAPAAAGAAPAAPGAAGAAGAAPAGGAPAGKGGAPAGKGPSKPSK